MANISGGKQVLGELLLPEKCGVSFFCFAGKWEQRLFRAAKNTDSTVMALLGTT